MSNLRVGFVDSGLSNYNLEVSKHSERLICVEALECKVDIQMYNY